MIQKSTEGDTKKIQIPGKVSIEGDTIPRKQRQVTSEGDTVIEDTEDRRRRYNNRRYRRY